MKEVLRLQHGRFAQQQQNLQPEADVQLQGSLETAAAVASISSALMDKEPQDDEESSTSANQSKFLKYLLKIFNSCSVKIEDSVDLAEWH